MGRLTAGNPRAKRRSLTQIARSFSVLAALLAPSQGCWTHARRLDQPTPIRREDTVWIWSRGNGFRWHDVSIEADSVTGIPYRLPLGCADCRQSLPRSEVDSIVDVRRGVTQYLLGAFVIFAFFRWFVFNPHVTWLDRVHVPASTGYVRPGCRLTCA